MIINEDTIAVKSSTAKRVYTFNVHDIAELITYKNERSSKVTYSVSYIDLNYWGGSWKNSWKEHATIPTKEVDIDKEEYEQLKDYLDNNAQIVSKTPITIHKLSYCVNRSTPVKIKLKDITND